MSEVAEVEILEVQSVSPMVNGSGISGIMCETTDGEYVILKGPAIAQLYQPAVNGKPTKAAKFYCKHATCGRNRTFGTRQGAAGHMRTAHKVKQINRIRELTGEL